MPKGTPKRVAAANAEISELRGRISELEMRLVAEVKAAKEAATRAYTAENRVRDEQALNFRLKSDLQRETKLVNSLLQHILTEPQR